MLEDYSLSAWSPVCRGCVELLTPTSEGSSCRELSLCLFETKKWKENSRRCVRSTRSYGLSRSRDRPYNIACLEYGGDGVAEVL